MQQYFGAQRLSPDHKKTSSCYRTHLEAIQALNTMGDREFADFSADPPKLQPSVSRRTLSATGKAWQPQSSPFTRAYRVIHRLIVFALAIYYVKISLHSFSTAMVILHGSVSHDLPIQTHTANLITGYTGNNHDAVFLGLLECIGVQQRHLRQQLPSLHLFQTANARVA